MGTVDLPRSSADIDSGWLHAALRSGGFAPDASLDAVEYVPVTAAVNLMGEVVRAKLVWNEAHDDLPESLIVKLPSPSPDNHALALAMGYYEAEHNFYRELAAHAGLRTPACLFTGGDAERGHYAVVLQDVGHLDVVDQSVGLDVDRSAGVMRAAASMHARWWNRPELERCAWLPVGFGEAIRVYGLLMQGGFPAWAASASEVLDADDIALAERFVTGYDALVDDNLDDPWTLLHRDFRVDNMVFDGTDPIVFDWGSVARGGALYDVAYFLGGSLETDVRRAHQDALLRSYRDALADAGVPDEGDDEFLRALRVGALFCLVVPILAGSDVIDSQDEQGRALITTILTRTFALLHDLDAAAAMPG